MKCDNPGLENLTVVRRRLSSNDVQIRRRRRRDGLSRSVVAGIEKQATEPRKREREIVHRRAASYRMRPVRVDFGGDFVEEIGT
jgi:hypothetical protein